MKGLKAALAVVALGIISYSANKYLLKKEEEKIKSYGTKVEINGKNFNIVELGCDTPHLHYRFYMNC